MRFVQSIPGKLNKNVIYLGIMIALALFAFRESLKIAPFDGDNLTALSVGITFNPLSYFASKIITYLPAYRPLAGLTIWTQYQILGLRMESYFLVNQLIWIACGILLFAIVCTISPNSKLIACLVALIFLFDNRALQALVWIGERQTTMACLFGSSAILLAISPIHQRWKGFSALAVFILLLASALSKEYGLAFSGAAVLIVWLDNQKVKSRMIIAAGTALVIYIFLRFGLAGGTFGNYCEDMGFFFSTRLVCFNHLSLVERLQQFGYNILATFLGTLIPSIFNGAGALNIPSFSSWPGLVGNLLILGVSTIAWIKHPKRTLPFLGLIVFNSLLSFMVYRGRNQIIGILGLDVSFAIGLILVIDYLRHYTGNYMVLTSVAKGIIIITLLWSITSGLLDMNRGLSDFQQANAAHDPCKDYRKSPKDINLDVVAEIKEAYLLSNPTCSK